MRKIVAISMPDEMHEQLRRSVSRTKYGSVSEYIRDLIRKDQLSAPPPERPGESSQDRFYREVFTSVRPANDVLAEYDRERRYR